MPRTRMVKPDFFLDEELCEHPPLTRILFAGLWCLADREGRLLDRPKKIKIQVLPYDDWDVNKALNALESTGHVKRYQSNGVKVISVVNFKRHQHIHIRELPSNLPDENGIIPVQEPDEHQTGTGSAPKQHRARTRASTSTGRSRKPTSTSSRKSSSPLKDGDDLRVKPHNPDDPQWYNEDGSDKRDERGIPLRIAPDVRERMIIPEGKKYGEN